jgi:hypothetical protein
MQFNNFLYVLLPAFCIGIGLALHPMGTQAKAMALGAQFSFLVKAGLMLFSDDWWPITARLFELALWVACGSIMSLVGYRLPLRVKEYVPCLFNGAKRR